MSMLLIKDNRVIFQEAIVIAQITIVFIMESMVVLSLILMALF